MAASEQQLSPTDAQQAFIASYWSGTFPVEQQHVVLRQGSIKNQWQGSYRELRLHNTCVSGFESGCPLTWWCCAVCSVCVVPQADLVKLQDQLRALEGRQARVGAVAASELEAALASVREGRVTFCFGPHGDCCCGGLDETASGGQTG